MEQFTIWTEVLWRLGCLLVLLQLLRCCLQMQRSLQVPSPPKSDTSDESEIEPRVICMTDERDLALEKRMSEDDAWT